MKNEVKTTNIRFNLGKEIQKKAWQYLQTMDKKKFKSYSNAVSIAIVYFFERYYRSENDPYLETREKEEKFMLTEPTKHLFLVIHRIESMN